MQSFSIWLELTENKNILKAVIILGGTGSGKTYASRFFEKEGFHSVQSDRFFTNYLQQANIPLAHIDLKDTEQQALWDKASEDAKQQMYGHMTGMEPIVYETTGRNITNVFEVKTALERAGYDVYGVFIQAPINVAMQRNLDRGRQGDRTINRAEFKQIHREVKDNYPIIKGLFGNNWFEVPYNDNIDSMLKQIVNQVTSIPVKNSKGIAKLRHI